jgi:hypothetical protein
MSDLALTLAPCLIQSALRFTLLSQLSIAGRLDLLQEPIFIHQSQHRHARHTQTDDDDRDCRRYRPVPILSSVDIDERVD